MQCKLEYSTPTQTQYISFYLALFRNLNWGIATWKNNKHLEKWAHIFRKLH